MEKSDKNPEISPKQMEVIRNLSSSLAEGQSALSKLLAGQSLDNLSASERQIVDKLLRPEVEVKTTTHPTPTTISSETAQVVRSAQAETKEQPPELEKIRLGIAYTNRISDNDFQVHIADRHHITLDCKENETNGQKNYKIKSFVADIDNSGQLGYRGQSKVMDEIIAGEGHPFGKLLKENEDIWEAMRKGLFSVDLTLKGDFGDDESNWPEVVENLSDLQNKSMRNAPWDKEHLFVEDGNNTNRKPEFYEYLGKLLDEIVEKYGDQLELEVENMRVEGKRWFGTLVLKWKEDTKQTTPETQPIPESKEKLTEQQKQIISAWQKASEFGKKAKADQMDESKLNREVRKVFEEELGPLGKQIKYGPGARIMYVPCTDDNDIEWYSVIHPTDGGKFSMFNKYFRLEPKSENIHIDTSKLEAIKPLAIVKKALFRAGKDDLSSVERFIPGIVRARE